MLILSNYVA